MTKKWLVNVPVAIYIWIRPDCQERQFKIIRNVRPRILFLLSDGGRNEIERSAIVHNRKMLESGIDWECTVYKVFEERNLGLYSFGKKAHQTVWKIVDRCIFLEDDILPSLSFFKYCENLLERYKGDTRICQICGMNHLGKYDVCNKDYFFSRQGAIWGYATWRRVYQTFYDEGYFQDTYELKLLENSTKGNKSFWKRLTGYRTNKNFEGHPAGPEYFFEFCIYGHHQIQIVPRVNLISNIGATSDSAHADELNCLPKKIRNLFNMKTFELNFPLRHPNYVIPDEKYANKVERMMGFNHPLIALSYKVQRFLLLIRHGKFSAIVKKIKQIVYSTSEK